VNRDPINPFYFGPVKEPEIFAGRREELNRLNGFLHDAERGVFRHAAILGKSGIGKTSLLNMFKKRAEEHGGTLVAHLDLYKPLSKTGDPLDLFRGLEVEILKGLRKVDPSLISYVEDVGKKFFGTETGALSQSSKIKLELGLPNLAGVTIERALKKGTYSPLSLLLRTDFDELAQRARKKGLRGIFVVLDEAHVLAELVDARTVLQLFKNTFQSQDSYSMIVYGDSKTLTRITHIHEGFGNLFEAVTLRELPRPDAIALIRSRLDWAADKGEIVKFEERAIEQIVEHSKGNPRNLVRFCCEAVEEARRRGTPVTTSLIKPLRATR